MAEALIGFFVGVAATYLAITQHRAGDDEIQVLLHELRGEEIGAGEGGEREHQSVEATPSSTRRLIRGRKG